MIWFLLVRPFLGPVQLDALTSIVRSKSWRDSGFRRTLLGFWAVAVGALAVAGRVELLFWYWVVPYFTVYPVLFFWDDMMAHYNCPKTGTREMRGIYFALMSTHGTNYHNIHHAYPAIPWFRMRRAIGMCVNERAVDAAHGFVDGMQQMIELAE
jgi:fatty acid desaturase